jgi:hypothetical protein
METAITRQEKDDHAEYIRLLYININKPITNTKENEGGEFMVDSKMQGMNQFTACSIVENFFNEEYSRDEQIAAWQYLIDCGAAWSLQGWYGRSAMQLIKSGVCHE